jgi:hypothetical protein
MEGLEKYEKHREKSLPHTILSEFGRATVVI